MDREIVIEWLQSDVANHFKSLLRGLIEFNYSQRADCFVAGNPQLTQEGRIKFLSYEAAFQDILDAFEEKDLDSLIVEEESDERIGDIP